MDAAGKLSSSSWLVIQSETPLGAPRAEQEDIGPPVYQLDFVLYFILLLYFILFLFLFAKEDRVIFVQARLLYFSFF